MKKFIILIFAIVLFRCPVNAIDFTAPEPPKSAEKYMPYEQTSFWNDLWIIVQKGLADFSPAFTEAITLCVSIIGVALLVSLLHNFQGISARTIGMSGALLTGLMLLKPTKTMVQLGIDTVRQISEYGKLLLPVMASALAAEGGVTTSTALYGGTVLFNSVLSTAVVKIISPLIFVYLSVMISGAGFSSVALENIGKSTKWLMTWTLKCIIFLFTGYISITGVISGATDAAALKAAKLTISGVVPVVGSMISDASEAVLVSAGLMKNAAGIYGLLAIAAIMIAPFIKIGIQYLLLKATAGVCKTFDIKQVAVVVETFSSAMGILLAMTGAVTLLFLINITCCMKGIG